MARSCQAGILLVLAVSAGCGTSGPEVRIFPLDPNWTPAGLEMLAPSIASGAVPAVKNLPVGVTPVTADNALSRVSAAIESALKEKSSITQVSVSGGLTRTDTGTLVERLRRQYMDERRVDPALAVALGNGLGADSVLLTAILRYGIEAENNPQQAAQNAVTKVGTSDVVISSAATRTTVWFNLHVRCALVRLSDGAIMWDAAIRDRRRPSLLGSVTMETVANEAVDRLFAAFPWLKQAPVEDAATGAGGTDAATPPPGAGEIPPPAKLAR